MVKLEVRKLTAFTPSDKCNVRLFHRNNKQGQQTGKSLLQFEWCNWRRVLFSPIVNLYCYGCWMCETAKKRAKRCHGLHIYGLSVCCSFRQKKCMGKLLEYSADVNICNNEGLTAVSRMSSFWCGFVAINDHVMI